MKLTDEMLKKLGVTNFNLNEVTQRQDDIPEDLQMNIIPTILLLQAIRNDIQKPITIDSTYRSPQHNADVGGKQNSLHMQFNAIDFWADVNLEKLYNNICHGKYRVNLIWEDKLTMVTPELMGAGLYSNFIHIDTRGLLGRKSPARWKG